MNAALSDFGNRASGESRCLRYDTVELSEGEDDQYAAKQQPWKTVVLDVTYKTLTGITLFQKRISLDRDWNGNSASGRVPWRRTISISISPWDISRSANTPLVTSYDMIIRVVIPSRRKTDSLRVNASRVYYDTLPSLEMRDFGNPKK
jgi:hypothetical protein